MKITLTLLVICVIVGGGIVLFQGEFWTQSETTPIPTKPVEDEPVTPSQPSTSPGDQVIPPKVEPKPSTPTVDQLKELEQKIWAMRVDTWKNIGYNKLLSVEESRDWIENLDGVSISVTDSAVLVLGNAVIISDLNGNHRVLLSSD